jgi:Ca-activated chloride channel family protein
MLRLLHARGSGLVVLALLLSAGALAAQGQAVFRAARELVRVYVTVTDQAGRLVTTLEREAFEIRDGDAQPIVAFDNTPTPIRIAVLLDVSNSMNGTLPLLQKAADELFVRLRPDDLARVGYFGNRIWVGSLFTRDAEVLRGALPGKEDRERAGGGTAIWRALVSVMQLFDAAAPERPVILVLSDGNNMDPMGKMSVTDVIDWAQRKGVMIYSVGVHGRGIAGNSSAFNTGVSAGALAAITPAMSDNAIHPDLRRVAEETGGGYLEVKKDDDLAVAFARVADELHSQYLLGYVPPKSDGKEHKIGVRVNVSGMRARARKTYVAPSSASSDSRPQ